MRRRCTCNLFVRMCTSDGQRGRGPAVQPSLLGQGGQTEVIGESRAQLSGCQKSYMRLRLDLMLIETEVENEPDHQAG